MAELEPFDFASFRADNAHHLVSGFDYIHAVHHTQRLSADFALCMAKLYWPEFVRVDGWIFVKETFDEAYYLSLLESDNSPAKNQFWMNLLEVTGLFENLSMPQSTVVANALAGSWNAKLASESGPSFAQARAIVDDEGCEVFVTIGFSD
ncbi:hypothetical protein [Pseudomonas viridiflava]|uniref:hypothetical protein n=1 Tax=Pseudomonas viridiflava TaxID=33069 RepID=UPI000F02C775|nr:hypothetical protein [Pseudomonas viridiflava]MEE4100778.1 hypothetical protein [Pseudomonas viridiflava]MEE4127344.1 hypothetical protein [Pseudomonas viridiflava]MEE4234177.1 hypothetical protein [Pseudomonas viridiflava]